MKALVGAFNQEKALVGAFSVIVKPVVEPMDGFTALILIVMNTNVKMETTCFNESILKLQVVYRNVSEDSAPAASCLEEHVAKLRLLNTVSGAVR